MVVAIANYLRYTRVYQRAHCRCGNVQREGKGSILCDVCVAEREAYRLCRGCGAKKEPGNPLYCEVCAPDHGPTPCGKCGSREPKPPGHKYCTECSVVSKEASAARKKARVIRNRKPCTRCRRKKPPGNGNRLCDACKKERNQPRTCYYCSNPVGKRKKLCDVCRARERKKHDEIRRQRDKEDPVRMEKVRKRNRDYSRRKGKGNYRRRKKTRACYVPARPLGRALVREAGEVSEGLRIVGASVGVSERAIRRWSTGEIQRVNLTRADAVLQLLGWSWFRVYDPAADPDAYPLLEWIDVVDQAVYAWTGERCLAP